MHNIFYSKNQNEKLEYILEMIATLLLKHTWTIKRYVFLSVIYLHLIQLMDIINSVNYTILYSIQY